jgi:hypothetical protein
MASTSEADKESPPLVVTRSIQPLAEEILHKHAVTQQQIDHE